MYMFFRSLQPRFARRLTGVPFQDFGSLVQDLFDVESDISRGLRSDITPSLYAKGKKFVRLFEIHGGVFFASV